MMPAINLERSSRDLHRVRVSSEVLHLMADLCREIREHSQGIASSNLQGTTTIHVLHKISMSKDLLEISMGRSRMVTLHKSMGTAKRPHSKLYKHQSRRQADHLWMNGRREKKRG